MLHGTIQPPNRSVVVPRYYFHLLNDVDAPDADGVELPNLVAAREHAIGSAVFTASETLKEQGRVVLDHRIIIEDANGRALDTVWFTDAIKIESEAGQSS